MTISDVDNFLQGYGGESEYMILVDLGQEQLKPGTGPVWGGPSGYSSLAEDTRNKGRGYSVKL